ncbi:hypothetical protein SUGI_0181980 [Cryptomeria japonica]|nr:hypothetical protein SUGI_0181980 [Cryptomeria japonica]
MGIGGDNAGAGDATLVSHVQSQIFLGNRLQNIAHQCSCLNLYCHGGLIQFNYRGIVLGGYDEAFASHTHQFGSL